MACEALVQTPPDFSPEETASWIAHFQTATYMAPILRGLPVGDRQRVYALSQAQAFFLTAAQGARLNANEEPITATREHVLALVNYHLFLTIAKECPHLQDLLGDSRDNVFPQFLEDMAGVTASLKEGQISEEEKAFLLEFFNGLADIASKSL